MRSIHEWSWVVALSGMLAAGIAAAKDYQPRLYRFQVPRAAEVLDQLVSDGFDIAGRNHKNGTMDVLVHSLAEEETLTRLGLGGVSVQTMPVGLAPDAGYLTPNELEERLKELAERYNNLATLESIGTSVEGRSIWAMKITTKDTTKFGPKSRIFFNSLHHAREVMTPEVAIDMIEQLLGGYDRDPKVTHWVKSHEIWVVPMVNPDGSQKVWSGRPMWRKNTRDGSGVDLNRNYPFAWNACNGSSGRTSADTYRGPAPASEPETQALLGLVERIQPVFSISYHSYSELVLYPYGCNGRRAEASEVIEPIGQDLAGRLRSDDGRGTYTAGTSWEVLYSVDGSDIDWMYGEQHVLPYVIEVSSDRQGFQPAYSWRQSTVERQRAGWGYLLDRLDGSGIRGVVLNTALEPRPDVPVVVARLGGSPTGASLGQIAWSESIQSVSKKDGSFHVVLAPGAYRVTFGSGQSQVFRDVMVGDQRVDFNMTF